MRQQLKEGTLTRFAGIPFNAEHPYAYLQAKRILGLFRNRLAKRPDLKRALDADPAHPGRGAIKGTYDSAVWDFVALRELKGNALFTKHPHLTVGIRNDQLDAMVTFPNGMRSSLRTHLLGNQYQSFADLVKDTTKRITHSLRDFKGAEPQVVVVQRRYPSMSARPIYGAEMHFDPRTAFKIVGKRTRGAIHHQPEWLGAAYTALRNRHSNLQLQIGAIFPYQKCPAVQRASIEEAVAATWIACKPMIEAARGK
jgi:hypothetical protein